MTFQELDKLIESLKREPIKNADLISFYENKRQSIILSSASVIADICIEFYEMKKNIKPILKQLVKEAKQKNKK